MSTTELGVHGTGAEGSAEIVGLTAEEGTAVTRFGLGSCVATRYIRGRKKGRCVLIYMILCRAVSINKDVSTLFYS